MAKKAITPPAELQHTPANCHAREMLARVGDKWSVYVIHVLGDAGTLRFNELRSRVAGISQRMLTVTLRGMERDGLVTRTVYPEVPPRVEYALTRLGRTLRQLVRGLGGIVCQAQEPPAHQHCLLRAQRLVEHLGHVIMYTQDGLRGSSRWRHV